MNTPEKFSSTPPEDDIFIIQPWMVWAVIGLTVLGLLGTGFFSVKTAAVVEEKEELVTEVVELKEEVKVLNINEKKLNKEIMTITSNFEVERNKNESLTSSIESKIHKINTLRTEIKTIQSKLNLSDDEKIALNQKVTTLKGLKSELEGDVDQLKVSNENLADINEKMDKDVTAVKGQLVKFNDQLNRMSQDKNAIKNRFNTIAPAGYTATKFRVEPLDKKGRLTAKAKKVNKVNVTFALDYVPVNQQGHQTLYLAVTDAMGKIIDNVPVKPIKINANNQTLKVGAVAIQKFELGSTQMLTMNFEPTSKLAAGDYHLMLYCEAGFLGSSGFSIK